VTHNGSGTLALAGNGLTVNGALSNSAGTLQTNNLAVTVGGATTLERGHLPGWSDDGALQRRPGGERRNFVGSSGAVTAGASA